MSDDRTAGDYCPHEDPRGRHHCPLCRVEVLAAAGQWRPKPYVHELDPTTFKPMPANFRDRVHQATATQPTLEDQ